ncbi:DUF6193 family natural product biosynthesis protein [Streptomyces panacea]|uniref:DUF6193 family natural product biosynthesis protein n=1 Tax=Streptomyces panacea TaxID=3035064 RepID=UPI00339BFD86
MVRRPAGERRRQRLPGCLRRWREPGRALSAGGPRLRWGPVLVQSPPFVSIASPRETGDYTIREWWNGPALHHVTTAAEAIAIAVGRIPADLLQKPSGRPGRTSGA